MMKMILDKLLEKKDLMIYFHYRLRRLREEYHMAASINPPQLRELAKRKVLGRMLELRRLKRLVHEGRIKEEGKILWRMMEGAGSAGSKTPGRDTEQEEHNR